MVHTVHIINSNVNASASKNNCYECYKTIVKIHTYMHIIKSLTNP